MAPALQGKRALIYGGGTGLGRACAEAMLAAGAKVFISGRREEVLEAARESLGRPEDLGLAPGDFTDQDDVDHVTRIAFDFLGGIDTLVLSSGTSAIGSVTSATLAQFEDVLKTNLVGPFLALKAAAPHLARSAPSSVILLASVSGVVGSKERIAYCTSKAGVLGMTRAAALDLAGQNVRVNAISPSLVLTELARDVISREVDPEATVRRREAQHPLGRLGRPDDIGSAAVYLASNDSGWVTGQNFIIDGGMTIA